MLKEKCGLLSYIGLSSEMLLQDFIERLEMLQHRGRDSVGLYYLSDSGEYKMFHRKGSIHEIFFENPSEDVKLLLSEKSKMIMGHLRYATSNVSDDDLIQPLVNSKKNIAVAHNGNIPCAMLKHIIKKINTEYFKFDVDVNDEFHDTTVFFKYLSQYDKTGLSFDEHLCKTNKYFNGAYNFIIMHNNEVYIVRDKRGYRPLCYGYDNRNNMLISSESVAFGNDYVYSNDIPCDSITKIVDNIVVKIDDNKIIKYNNSNCVFEYIYFMNELSIVKTPSMKISVETYRIELGNQLALQEMANGLDFGKYDKKDILVVGSPNTAIPGAIAYAKKMGLDYQQVLIKKKNTGRTFIILENDKRNVYFKKFELNKEKIKNKIIIFIDDSIVRGNTIENLCYLFKNNGASEIHVRSLSPPIAFPCYYGIHVPTKEELIINNNTIDEITNKFNLDSLMYLDINRLKNIFKDDICMGCFNGQYDPDILF